MKKIKYLALVPSLFVLLMLVMPDMTTAQVAGSNNFLPNYDPPSPEAASLGKYVDHPISNYTGIPKIQIPLFEIKTGRITVPISISYHASGVRIDELASRTGMGWSLNAGGVITRTVKGLPDDTPTQWSNGYPSYHNGYFSGQANIGSASTGYYPDQNDFQPDLHFYNFGDKSGKMYFSNRTTAYCPDKKPLKVDGPYNGNNRFIITDADGIVYTFSATEGGTHDSGSLSFNYTASWFLTMIYDPVTSKSVQFQYRTDMPSFFNYISGKPRSESPTCNSSSVGRTNDNWVMNSVSTPKVLQKIIYDGGYIEFKADWMRADLPGDRAYTEINQYVNTGSGALKRGYVLNYTNSHAYGSNGSSPDDNRLFLESIREKGANNTTLPPYSFTYKNRNLLPYRLSPQKDIWGFYNANGADGNASTSAPKVYVNNSGAKTDYLPFPSIYNNNSQIIPGVERASNPLTIDYGTLQKITYPTGGTVTYNYEIHEFDSYKGGGIRIKEIIRNTAPSAGTLKTRYLYQFGQLGGAYPQVAYPVANSTSLIRFSQNMAILGSCQGSNVGYGYVSVQDVNEGGQVNGTVTYTYSQEKDVEGLFEPIVTGCDAFAFGYNGNLSFLNQVRARTYFPFFEMESREARRGNLLVEEYLDANDNSIKSIKNSYTLSSELKEYVNAYYVLKSDDGGIQMLLKGTTKINAEKMLLTSKIESMNTGAAQGTQAILSKLTSYSYTQAPYDTYFLRSENNYRTSNWPNRNTSQQELEDFIPNFESQKIYKYPFDYAATASNGCMGQMVAMHYISPVISEVSIKTTTPGGSGPFYYTGGKVTSYKLHSDPTEYSHTFIVPNQVYIFNSSIPVQKTSVANLAVEVTDPGNPGSLYESRLNYLKYDSYANPTVVRHGSANELKYEKFEWSFSGKLLSKSLTPNPNTTSFGYPPQSWGWYDDPENPGKYFFIWDGYDVPFPFYTDGSNPTTITFWAKGGNVGIWAGDQSDPFFQLIEAPANWTYFKVVIPGQSPGYYMGEVYMVGGAILKDVLITNENSQKTTYTYDPYQRLQSVTDPKNQMTKYEYDAFSRLINVKDKEGRIIKNLGYHYAVQ